MKVNIKKKFSVILTTLLIMACSEQADIEILKLSVGEEKTISDVVAVNGGTIRGIAREGGLHEYLGIPYAAAPVGADGASIEGNVSCFSTSSSSLESSLSSDLEFCA